jgi:hypothetical protein
VRTLRLGRELLDGHALCKLEVLGDPQTLFPNMPETLKAAATLVKDGFQVMVYCADDPIQARMLEDIGCVAIMPLASLIGSGMGILNPWNLKLIIEQAKVPVLVDAGVGTASDAAIAMELGCDGVLMNTAIAGAQDPVLMAGAMKKAVEAGREAFRAGRMALQRHQHLVQHLLRIAEQHAVVLLVEERIVHAGVARGHRALHDDRGLGLPDFEHRHAGDRAGRIVLRRRVHDVVGADHHGHVGGREVVVELVHFHHDVVGHLGFGQQHVHVAGHAPRHRVDAEADVDALLAQVLGDFIHRVLGLRHRHAVAGNDDHALGILQQFGGLGGADRHHFTGRLRRLALGRRRAPPPVPKPPAMTLMKLRFIAGT